SWARNSGDGTVPDGEVDELLDAAYDMLPRRSCEICGSAGGPVRQSGDPDPRVPQVVCVDAAACMQRCTDTDDGVEAAEGSRA
ncbi:MAG TPA: hypothetical protein VJT31_36095, partial [Rugosimonospora sp.]|nr:hypothetical protein [Rugosimonospora sp.]